MTDNAFALDFLDRLAEHDEPATSREASTAGPWRVVALGPDRWGVVQDGDPEPYGVFKARELALLAAAISRGPSDGQVIATQLGQVSTARAYNQFGEPLGDSAAFGATPIWDASYSRDKRGRITQKAQTIDGSTDVYDYTYDLTGRLAGVEKNGILVAENTYDANGNRLTSDGTFGAASGTYDTQDRLITYGDVSYQYTAAGELASKTVNGQTATYHYDALGALLSAEASDGVLIEYVVDGRNRRIGKKVNGTLSPGSSTGARSSRPLNSTDSVMSWRGLCMAWAPMFPST